MQMIKSLSMNNITADVIVAVDPDVEKSGVCFYEPATKKLEAASLSFPELIDYLRWLSDQIKLSKGNFSAVVLVEAGWLNKSHWHGAYQKGSRVSASIGNSTGRNHETGRKIIECANHYGLATIEQQPLVKRWHGTDGKITQEELTMVMNGMRIPPLTTRVNQDVRDAVLLAIVYADRHITDNRNVLFEMSKKTGE